MSSSSSLEQHPVQHHTRPKGNDGAPWSFSVPSARRQRVTQQVVAVSSKGEEDANAIYTDIVHACAAHREAVGKKEPAQQQSQATEVQDRLPVVQASRVMAEPGPTRINTPIELIRGYHGVCCCHTGRDQT